jgi:hypothetical protein
VYKLIEGLKIMKNTFEPNFAQIKYDILKETCVTTLQGHAITLLTDLVIKYANSKAEVEVWKDVAEQKEAKYKDLLNKYNALEAELTELAKPKGDAVPEMWMVTALEDHHLKRAFISEDKAQEEAGIRQCSASVVPLFTHAQPVPVVVLPRSLPDHEWAGDYPSEDSESEGFVYGFNAAISLVESRLKDASINFKFADVEGE